MKILSDKKYNELILKSCKGMFGAVTDDMLLRDNALLNEENKKLKEELKYTVPIVEHNKIVSKKLKENQKYKEVIDKTIELTKNLLKTEDRGYYQIIFKEILKSVGDKERKK